ncbi:lysylphosphatidylglycerol synthase domain-containing protein [Baekduia sp. Peel2402]|uniref:lysylphosphatidylglycerol synthase domain-containing protein n=1 Tax=Baekduia sp. Peel2402 TaxID=3458296 RepID=UPI00403E5B85
MTSRQRRTAIWAVVAILVACFLALSVVSQVGDIKDFDWHFSPGWLAASILLFIAFQAMHGALWTLLVRATGGDLPFGAGIRIFSISLLTRYVPTQILMAVTRLSMLAGRGVPRSVAAASLAYEFPLAVGSSFALSVAFLIDLPELKGHDARWLVLLAPVVLLSLLHPKIVDAIESRLSARLGVESEHLTLPLTRLAPFVVGYVLSFAVAGLGVYAFARSIYADAPLDLRVLTSYAIGYSAAVLAFFIPGGLGARDGATATALAAVMPSKVAIAAAIGVRLIQTLIELAYAGTAELAHRKPHRLRKKEPA